MRVSMCGLCKLWVRIGLVMSGCVYVCVGFVMCGCV